MRSSPLFIFLCGALSAAAAPRAQEAGPKHFDAFLASPRARAFDASRLPRSLREQVNQGLVSSTEPRTGVPTFFWAPRSPKAADLKAQGVTAEQAARRALFNYAGLWHVDGKRAAAEATAKVHDLGFGAVIVTFALPEQGLEVFRDEVHVVMNQKLEVLALSGSFNPSRRVEGGFSLAPETAIVAAWQDLLGTDVAPAPTDRESGPYRFFSIPGDRDVRVKKVFFPLPSGLVPAYYLELHPLREGSTSSAYVAYVLSANDGRLLLRNDLTRYDSFSYRVWADESDIHRPYDGPQGDDPSPNPTGMVSTYNPPWTMPPLIALSNGPISTNDPWLPPAATTTQGNNVYAYADFNAPDGFSAGDITATATATGVFDRTYDVTLAAASSSDQRQAAITQLFFNVNFFHDWYYDLGFDEKAGNAQTDNLGRGGIAMDELHAEAQDYSGVDNSNMSTPADGMSPVMQMYVFDDGSEPTVTENSPATATFNAYGGTLGPSSYSVTADLLPIVSGTGLGTGCSALTSASGKIVMVARGGGCQSSQKATNAQNAGAVGLIIVSTSTFVSPPSGTGSTIPAVSMSAADGATLKALAASGTVNLTLSHPPVMYRDGAIDNTIVAHEWGHYIQNRLIADGSGLGNNQGAGMAEGWADFHAMLLIVRAEDAQVASNPNYSGVYALAGYAMQLLEPRSYYFGIRRVPYSTDLTKDGLTFKMIGDGVPLPSNVPTAFGLDGSQNSEAHNTGEVWSTMLWECYASLLRDTTRLTFDQAQTRMRSYIVGGYKATPVNPTVLEARDAILATAEAADPVDFTAFVTAFAKRGAGIYAIAPDRASTDNNPVTESYDDGNGAMITGIALDDSAASCDHDGVLDDGETGVATVTVKNVGVGALSSTHLVITSDTPGLEIQGPADFGPIARLANGTATVKVKANGIASKGVLSLTATVSDASFSGGPQTLTASFGSDFDVANNSSATDDVEAPTSAWTTMNSAAPDGAWGITAGSPTQHWWLAHGGSSPDLAQLTSPPLIVGTGPFSVSFKERYDFEMQSFGGQTSYFDGAIVELTDDGGGTWTDVGAMLTPGYGGTLAAMMSANPLSGEMALVGQSDSYPSFIDGKLDLGTAYAGKTVQIRFSEGSDDAVGLAGWEIDDIAVTGITNTPFSTVIVDPHSCKKVNQAPVVTIAGPADANATDTVTLTANATDPDGDAIAGYAWTQVAGNPVALAGIGTGAISFAAPTLSVDQHFVFAVKVSDGQLTTTATADVLVHAVLPPPAETPGKKSGCGCNGVDALMPILSLLALTTLRRRRS